MYKTRIILLIIIGAGILFAGAGAGMAFHEFASFTYAGEKEAGPMDRKTVDMDFGFRATEEAPLNVERTYGHFTNDNDIVESEEVPENTVRFRVTYNAEAVEPFVDAYESGQSVRLSWFYIATNRSKLIGFIADDFRNFMECKNIFLEGIRKREFISFHTTGIEELEIMVNPASKSLIHID